MSDTPDYDSYEFHRARYERDVAHIARKLRDMADEVERRGRKLGPAGEGERPHSDIAAHLTHTIGWGFANLHLDDLVRDAAKADLYQPGEAGP